MEVSQANEEAREDFMHVDVPLSENQMEVDHPSATNEEDGVENDNHVSLNITESLDRMQKTLSSRTRYLLDIFKISTYLSGVFFLLASYRYLLNIYKNITRLSYL